MAYQKQKDYAQSIAVLKEAIRCQPDNAEAYLQLADSYFYAGEWEESLEAAKQLVRLRPDDEISYWPLTAAYHELGRWQDVIDANREPPEDQSRFP